MRVCLVCPYSWSFPGGVLEHVDSLAHEMARRGHEVRIIAPDDPLDLRTRLLHPKLGRHGKLPSHVVPVSRSVPLPSNGSLANLAFSPALIRKVERFLKDFRPHVVHVHEPLLPLLPLAALRAGGRLKIPLVGTFHAYYPEGCAHYRLFRPLLSPYERNLSARIAVSGPAARTASQYFPAEYSIVPNGVEVERFKPREGTQRDPLEILFVGRAARKGLPVLMEALALVRGRIPGAHVTIVGSRPRDVSVPRGLESCVRVRGMVDEEELVAAMHSASVLCAPSTGAESFGIVLIEGMSAGMAVVASDIPGYNAVVRDGDSGVLVHPGDARSLAEALVRLLTDAGERERLSRRAIEGAKRYDWSRVGAEVERIYRGIARC